MIMKQPLMTVALLVCSAAGVQASNHAVIDWSAWDAILRAHVVDGMVDYDGVRADPGFGETVEAIAGADLTGYDTETRLVFLINAYNVLSVKGILDGHSPRTAFGKLKFFFRVKYDVAGDRKTLNALEHKLIIPLGEPRIHFAIVCSSISCPPLRSEAFTVDRLDEQLEENAVIFLNDPTKNGYDLERGEARLSKIFKWFSKDFGGSSESIQRFIAPYVSDGAVSQKLASGRFKVRYMAYDWSLNGTLTRK
jgi:hypothetical protein